MLGTASFVFGILLAAIVLAVARRRDQGEGGLASKPTPPGWWTLAFGLTGVTAFAVAAWLTTGDNLHGSMLWLISITLSFAAVVVGIGTVIRRDRHWPTWTGLAAGLAPAIFWVAFAAAHVFGSGD